MKIKFVFLFVLFILIVQGVGSAEEDDRTRFYYELGRTFFNNGDYYDAMNNYNRALEINPNYAPALNGRGEIHLFNNDYIDAERNFNEAIKADPYYENAYVNRGFLYKRLGNIDSVIIDWKKVLELNPENNDVMFELSEIYYSYGIEKLNNLNFSEAINYFEIACNINIDHLFARYRIIDIYFLLNDYINVLKYTYEVKNIRERTLGKYHPDNIITLNNLGRLYISLYNYYQAEHYLLEMKYIIENTLGKENPRYIDSLNKLGHLYISMGDFVNAEYYYIEVKHLFDNTNRTYIDEYLISLNGLGFINIVIGDYIKAEYYLLQALNIYENATINNDSDLYIKLLINLSGLYQNTDDILKAEHFLLTAINYIEKEQGKLHFNNAIPFNNLGVLYLNRGDYSKAEQYLLDAAIIRLNTFGNLSSDYAVSLNNLAFLYKETGNYYIAEQNYLEASNILELLLGKNHIDLIRINDSIYYFYLYIMKYNNAFSIKQEINEQRAIHINQFFFSMSEHQRNLYWNRHSLDFDSTYSLSFHYPIFESNIISYNNAIFTKGFLLRTTNAIRDAIYATNNQELISQFEKLRDIRQQINNLQQTGNTNLAYIQSLEQQAEELDKSLMRYDIFKEAIEDLNINWKDVQEKLQPNEAAIEFVSFRLYDKGWTDRTIYAALVLRPGMEAPAWVPLCEENELKEIFDHLTGRRPRMQTELLYNVYGNALYSAIWQPLEKKLEGVDTIFFSPSGLLHKVSFNAIPVGDSKRLMDIYDLNLVSSTREVVYRNRTTQLPDSAAIYGGLFYDNPLTCRFGCCDVQPGMQEGIWSYLSGTRDETDNIHFQLYVNNISSVLLNEIKGDKDSFRNLDGNRTGIIHLATHGFFEDDIEKKYELQERLERLGIGRQVFENPLMKSGLILSGGNRAWTENPIEGLEISTLYADDIARMNLLGTELVVLSACETGLGISNNSEGVFGLQRAFKLAGAQTIIMSLWEVSDRASSDFMIEFYTNWLSGMTKQEAFKKAQISIRNQSRYSSPYFWAAFVLMD